MKLRIRDLLNHKLQTAFYKCVICSYTPTEPKEAALPAKLPAFHEEYCPECRANRKFIMVE